MKIKKAVAAGFAAALMVYTPAWGFSFNDITYWIGSGTNKCAVVIDFNDGSVANCSFAWGFRWNGDAPSMKAILDEITAEDPRLKMFASASQYGSFIEAFGYDVDGDGGTFTMSGFVKSDADDLFPATESSQKVNGETGNVTYLGTSWMQLYGTGAAFDDVVFVETPNGVDLTNPENGEWYCWRLCAYATTYDSNWNFIDYYCDISSEYVPISATRTFRMDKNIRFWIGNGTNECAVVVDFNDDSVENCSFAWGYRWNGEAPSMKAILDEITAKDKRLKMFASVGQYGSYIEAFGYDVDGDGGTFTMSGFVKSDADDLFPATESSQKVDGETGNVTYLGTSWMQLYGTGAAFDDVVFVETPNGVDLTNPENGEWYCWRLCTYATTYDSNWNFLDYHVDTDSTHVAVAARPSETQAAALPKVGFSAYASLDAAFDAARGGGAVTLPAESSVNAETKTVTVGSAADETLQTYEVPAYFDMNVSNGAVSLALNAAAAPTLTATSLGEEPPFTVGEATVTVVPGNVINGLYYGLAVSTNLTAGFSAPTEWIRAENGMVVLEKAKNAAATGEFYKVRVSDVDETAK